MNRQYNSYDNTKPAPIPLSASGAWYDDCPGVFEPKRSFKDRFEDWFICRLLACVKFVHRLVKRFRRHMKANPVEVEILPPCAFILGLFCGIELLSTIIKAAQH